MRYLLTAALVFVCAVGAFAGTATLTWTDNIVNEAGFYIERAPVACAPVPTTFVKIGEAAKDAKTYVDNTAVDGNKYCYRVRAWNLMYATDPTSIQFGTWSNIAEKDFPLAGPVGDIQLGVN
jgi:hypothetical protein